jgi:hypothetical protein
VNWDLAAILIAREADSFQPSFVMMNGVALDQQPLWIELGSINRAMPAADGSGQLQPVEPAQGLAPIITSAPDSDTLKGSLLSWNSVRAAARAEIAAQTQALSLPSTPGPFPQGAIFAGFPRSWGDMYICNNTSYVVNWLMANPGSDVTLLTASTIEGSGVDVSLANDMRSVPRVFVHWPSQMPDSEFAAGAQIMRAIVDAQLTATEKPTVGDNTIAELPPENNVPF